MSHPIWFVPATYGSQFHGWSGSDIRQNHPTLPPFRVVGGFFLIEMMQSHSNLPPRSLTFSPLKNDGWKTSLSSWDGDFSGAMLNFQGVTSPLGVASGDCLKKSTRSKFLADLGKPTLSFCWVNDLEPAQSGFSISTDTCPDLWGLFPCCQKNGSPVSDSPDPKTSISWNLGWSIVR